MGGLRLITTNIMDRDPQESKKEWENGNLYKNWR